MITHHFFTDDDILNGYFSDDFGERRYSYFYDPDSKLLTVDCGRFRREKDLSKFGVDRMSQDELRDRLIALAQEIGEDLKANPPVQN